MNDRREAARYLAAVKIGGDNRSGFRLAGDYIATYGPEPEGGNNNSGGNPEECG